MVVLVKTVLAQQDADEAEASKYGVNQQGIAPDVP